MGTQGFEVMYLLFCFFLDNVDYVDYVWYFFICNPSVPECEWDEFSCRKNCGFLQFQEGVSNFQDSFPKNPILENLKFVLAWLRRIAMRWEIQYLSCSDFVFFLTFMLTWTSKKFIMNDDDICFIYVVIKEILGSLEALSVILSRKC